MSRVPERVGVYGGGRMGAGIAHAFLVAGSSVVVVENSPELADVARDRIAGSLAKAAAKGDAPTSLIGLQVSVEAADLEGSALVIEAVPEDATVKRQVLEVISQVTPDAVVASNTSSLSIDSLADGLIRPERFLGLHFFNPVPVSSLVEIVVGKRTRPDLVDSAREWVAALGKTAITVTDSPGFASSRLGVSLALEAIRMVQDGVGSVEDVDTAMTLGYRHPTGPLRTTDIVGLDVRLAIAGHLARELGPRFEPPQLLKDLVAAGHLGRKTGRGFYSW